MRPPPAKLVRGDMAIRMLVTIAIILPLMLVVGLNRPWYVTFGIAVLGFGAGRAVEYMVTEKKKSSSER